MYQRALRESSLDSTNTVLRAEHIIYAVGEPAQRSRFTIGSSSARSTISSWWNEDWDRAYRCRKAAWKCLMHTQSPLNWSNYKYRAVSFKRTVDQTKDIYNLHLNTFLSKPENQKALYRFMERSNSRPSVHNSLSVVLTPYEAKDVLEKNACGIARCFQAQCSIHLPRFSIRADFQPVTFYELFPILSRFLRTTPGHYGVSVRMLKFLANEFPYEILSVFNTSLENAWIPGAWKVAKVHLLQKDPSKGLALDNIRPIALTVHLVKLIERMPHNGLVTHLTDVHALSSVQIDFRRGCSIWSAHVDLEALRKIEISAFVTLDIAKAYDSVEYKISLQKLASYDSSSYIMS